MPESVEEAIDRKWEERAKHFEDVRKRLRSGWRNDENVLLQYFQSCIANWKLYKGERTPEQILKLYGLYRQATVGDCDRSNPPQNLKNNDGIKWLAWERLYGKLYSFCCYAVYVNVYLLLCQVCLKVWQREGL